MKTSRILISTFVAAAAMNLPAFATFTWRGGESITSDAWATESNWTLSEGETWKSQGTGPGTAGSNMWNAISISDASGSVSNMEGWTLNLTLVRSDLTIDGLVKLQGGCSLNIDAESTLTIKNFGYTTGNDGETTTVNNNGGTFNFQLAKDQGGEGFVMNLAESGTVNISGANHTAKVKSISGSGTFAVADTGCVASISNISSFTGTFSIGEGAQITLVEDGKIESSTITVDGGGDFELAGTVTSTAKISVATGATVSVANTAVFDLAEGVTSYTFIRGDGAISGWDQLSKNNFTINGESLGGRQTATFDTVGTVTISGTIASLVWGGNLSGTWDTETANQVWTNSGTSSQDSFYSGDNVTFDTADASVTLGSAISAGTVTISKNTTLTISSTNTLTADSVSVADGKTLTLEGTGALAAGSWNGAFKIADNAEISIGGKNFAADGGASVTFAGASGKLVSQGVDGTTDLSAVSGAGTVSFGAVGNTSDSGAGNSSFSTLKLGSGFTGTVEITSGVADMLTGDGTSSIDSSRFGGATKVVLDGGGLLFRNVDNTTQTGYGSFDTAIEVGEAGGVIRVYGNGNVTVASDISGAGTLRHTDGGTLTLTGTVNMTGGFSQVAGTTNFNGATTLGTLSVSSGTANFTGATTIGAVSQTNGTLNFKSASTTIASYKGPTSAGGGTNPVTNVVAGANLNVTGEFYLRYEGNGTSTLNVDGNMIVGGALNLSRDGNGIVNVSDGGTLVAASVGFGQNWSGDAKSSVINLASGGTLVAGSMTKLFANINSSSLNLNGGTLGTNAASLTISVDSLPIVLGTGTTSTINTGKYDAATKTFTDTATEIVISNAISGEGGLLKTGAGTLKLGGTANNTFTGGVEIAQGVVEAAKEEALGTGPVTIDGGHLEVASGVALNLNSITVVLGSEYESGKEGSSAAIIGTGALTSGTTITLMKSAEEAAAALAAETATETFAYKIFEENSTLATSADKSWFTLGEGLNDDRWAYSYENGILTLSMIPEPSAFGLLAGVGALALVAARRRRKS